MLFQPAPKSVEEAEKYGPLDIPPDQVLEMDEKEWYQKVYRGDVPQLTVRAVLVGSFLGFFLAFTNLYIGLKTGWGLGVAITACIIAYAMWNGLFKVGLVRTPMTILEINCMQSTASSAGYATGGTMVSAIAALLMLSATPMNPKGQHLPWTVLSLWTLFLAALGTLMAIPMKRNMINHERLKFPSGTAAAVTLHSLYSHGAEALKKARALFVSAGIGAVFPVLIELNFIKTKEGFKSLLPPVLKIFDGWLPALGYHLRSGISKAAGAVSFQVDLLVQRFNFSVVPNKPSHWTMYFDMNPVMIAAGALVGVRVAFYMLLGSLLLIFVVGPMALTDVWVNARGELVAAASFPWKAWKEIGIWLGVPIMVSSGLLTFILQWRTIARAFSGLKGGSADEDELVKKTEVPFSWFVGGVLVSGFGVIWVGHVWFEIPWHYGVLAVFLTFFLSLVACRATGESDITPVGAMGKIMQLTYGVLIPQSTTANLMTASITASAAGSSADLLNDLKSGYLLGANPRRQFMAQFLGIFAGTIATVSGFYLLVPNAVTLLGEGETPPKFPAPAAQAWKAVAEIFKFGLKNMHPTHLKAIYVGLALGVVFVLLERAFPKWKKWLPSATGLGLGLILPFQYPLSMFIGAVAAWIWQKKSPQSAKDYLVPVSAGLIAGISLMGVIVAVLNNTVFGH